MMVFKKCVAAVSAAWLMLMAQAVNAQDIPSVSAPLGDVFKVPNLLVKSQSRVVFYRDKAKANAGKVGVVSLYVGGEYLASVQQGGFAELCFAPGPFEVAARYVQNGIPPKDGVDLVNSLSLRGGEEVFVKVLDDANGQPVMMVARPELALPELLKTRRQQHTISRVDKAVTCEDREKPELPPVVVSSTPLRRATLSADALFAFGKSDIDSIPPKGRRLLDHLVDRIKSEYGAGKDVRIHIVGHADRFGSEAGNLRVSKERAASIKRYFVNSGLLENSITTDGRGDKEPVVNTCGAAYTHANVACNKPNRRVDLDIRKKPTAEASN